MRRATGCRSRRATRCPTSRTHGRVRRLPPAIDMYGHVCNRARLTLKVPGCCNVEGEMPNRLRRYSLISFLLLAFAGAALRAQPSKATLNQQLVVAAANGDVAAVADLLKRGADVHASNEYGTTPL